MKLLVTPLSEEELRSWAGVGFDPVRNYSAGEAIRLAVVEMIEEKDRLRERVEELEDTVEWLRDKFSYKRRQD